jgi:hypothetical protein
MGKEFVFIDDFRDLWMRNRRSRALIVIRIVIDRFLS